MNSLEHFRAGLERAVARNKDQKPKQHIQRTQHAVQKVDSNYVANISNPITATAKITAKASTAKLSEDEYRTWITAKAIAHIKQKGVM